MIDVKENVELAQYTTFDIGGPAKYFVEVSGEEELREALNFARAEGLHFFVLSGGTNVLFNDTGFDGLVIRMIGTEVAIYRNNVIADAGTMVFDVITLAGDAGLAGMENMYGVPGSVGGAVRGNAGAFGTEVKDILSKVRALNMQTGEVRDFNNKECELGYRTSYFKTHPEWAVLTAVFKLESGADKAELKAKREAILAKRGGKHDQSVKCAGSFFKNPMGTPEAISEFETDKGVESRGGKVPAGWLVDQCGCRGTKVGGAECSEQQANYIMNVDNATQVDVLELREQIINKVKDKYNIELEEEVTIVK
jgi:UDP-N-acetylmuramate dehydrogenase